MYAENIDDCPLRLRVDTECMVARSAVIELPGATVRQVRVPQQHHHAAAAPSYRKQILQEISKCSKLTVLVIIKALV